VIRAWGCGYFWGFECVLFAGSRGPENPRVASPTLACATGITSQKRPGVTLAFQLARSQPHVDDTALAGYTVPAGSYVEGSVCLTSCRYPLRAG